MGCGVGVAPYLQDYLQDYLQNYIQIILHDYLLSINYQLSTAIIEGKVNEKK